MTAQSRCQMDLLAVCECECAVLEPNTGSASCTWSTISFLQKFWELVRVAPVFVSFFVCTSYLCRHDNTSQSRAHVSCWGHALEHCCRSAATNYADTRCDGVVSHRQHHSRKLQHPGRRPHRGAIKVHTSNRRSAAHLAGQAHKNGVLAVSWEARRDSSCRGTAHSKGA